MASLSLPYITDLPFLVSKDKNEVVQLLPFTSLNNLLLNMSLILQGCYVVSFVMLGDLNHPGLILHL